MGLQFAFAEFGISVHKAHRQQCHTHIRLGHLLKKAGTLEMSSFSVLLCLEMMAYVFVSKHHEQFYQVWQILS